MADENLSVRDSLDLGRTMHRLVMRLYPICRSITGDGVRETLRIIKEQIPLRIFEVPSGTKVFDWTIPKEWNIRDAYVSDENGQKIIDFKQNNLHVIGYAAPVNKVVDLPELQEHLYSLENQPNAIPYVTSYYKERWGFSLPHNQRVRLKEGRYRAYIDSDFKEGHLSYGEQIIPGKSSREILISTYICHPSMANNELSGPVVTTFLAKWIAAQRRRYTYRIVFVPETIGALTYLSKNLEAMKKNVIAGFNVTCVGDERAYSFLPSRQGNTLADKVALNVLGFRHPDYIKYSFLDRGSDERQYCSPGVDLPVVSVMRSKYGEYPEYHTSLDDLDLVTPAGLLGGYQVLKDCLEALEQNYVYRTTCLGEPQLGKRGLYPTIGTASAARTRQIRAMMDMLAYADGSRDLIDISNLIHIPLWELYPVVKLLNENALLEVESGE